MWDNGLQGVSVVDALPLEGRRGFSNHLGAGDLPDGCCSGEHGPIILHAPCSRATNSDGRLPQLFTGDGGLDVFVSVSATAFKLSSRISHPFGIVI